MGPASAAACPHIGYVYPAGGRQGASFQVKVGGQLLDGVTNVHVSGPGIRAAVLEHVKPLTTQQFNTFREKLKELQEKRNAALKTGRRGGTRAGTNVFTAQDQKTFAEIRMKLANYQGDRPILPSPKRSRSR